MNKKNREQIKYRGITKELLHLKGLGQKMRQNYLERKQKWNHNLDKRNTEHLKKIIGEIGWPTILKVGREAYNATRAIVQHSDHDVKFQKQCLEMMKQDLKTDKRNIALLEDRIRVNEGKLQIYGTQFYTDENGDFKPRPIKEPGKVDKRRKKLRMGTLEEYKKGLLRMQGK